MGRGRGILKINQAFAVPCGLCQVLSQCLLATALGARYCCYFTDKGKETHGGQAHVQGFTADQQWDPDHTIREEGITLDAGRWFKKKK